MRQAQPPASRRFHRPVKGLRLAKAAPTVGRHADDRTCSFPSLETDGRRGFTVPHDRSLHIVRGIRCHALQVLARRDRIPVPVRREQQQGPAGCERSSVREDRLRAG